MSTYNYHRIFMGVRQSQTNLYPTTWDASFNPTAYSIATTAWDTPFDPTTNSSVIDLNGMATNPSATYGILSHTLTLGGTQRLTTTNAVKGKHGEDFSDYHFTNREIKFKMKVNCLDVNGNGSFDTGLAAIQKLQAYINNAYQHHIYTSNRSGSSPTPSQPIILSVQLAGSAKLVYFDIVGGFVDTKDSFTTEDIANNQVQVDVTLVAKYSARGDFVWLANLVPNGNFLQDNYNNIHKYWSFSQTNYTFGSIYDTTPPPNDGSGSATRLAITGSTAITCTSTANYCQVGSKGIVDLYYKCGDAGATVTVKVWTRSLTSDTNNLAPTGVANTVLKTFNLPNNFSSGSTRYTSTVFTILNAQVGNGASNYGTNVWITIDVSGQGVSAKTVFSKVALWQYPPYAQNPTAPTTEYINVIPNVHTDATTKIYGVRGDIESETLIQVEPCWYSGQQYINQFQTLSMGLRQTKGFALPKYHQFEISTGTPTVYGFSNIGVSSTTTTSNNVSATNYLTPYVSGTNYQTNYFITDTLPRNYKVYVAAGTNDVVGLGLNVPIYSNLHLYSTYNVGPDIFNKTILPNSTYPYLPIANIASATSMVLLDCGLHNLPNSGVNALPTNLNFVPGKKYLMNINGRWLPNYSTMTSGNTVNVKELHLLPADQFFYCDTRHYSPSLASLVAGTGADYTNAGYDNTYGWASTAPLWIDSLTGQVKVAIGDESGIIFTTDTNPQYTNTPLKLYPANGNWRKDNATNPDWPLSDEDTMPTEIACLPRTTDASQPDYIARVFDGFGGNNPISSPTPATKGKALDHLVKVGYYPRYIDFASSST